MNKLTNTFHSFLLFHWHCQSSELSLPGSPFLETLVLKHSSPTTYSKGLPSSQNNTSAVNASGGSLHRYRHKQAEHSKRSSLSDRKRLSRASSLGISGYGGVCAGAGGHSDTSSLGPQLSWRSSCGGMRRGLTCHPMEHGHQLSDNNYNYPICTTQQQPYMLSYSPSTYLEAHANRLPYVDDSTAVSPATSSLSIPIQSTSSTHCNHQHQCSCYQHNEQRCQFTLDHNHYHNHHHSSGHQQVSPPIPHSSHKTNHSSLSPSSSNRPTSSSNLHPNQNSATLPNGDDNRFYTFQVSSSPTHQSPHLKTGLCFKSCCNTHNEEWRGTCQLTNHHQRINQYTCLPHSHIGGQPNSIPLTSSDLNSRTHARRSYDLAIDMLHKSDNSHVLMNSVDGGGGGEVCNGCLTATSDNKRLYAYHQLCITNNMHAATNNNMNVFGAGGGGLRSRHNSYCSHTSRWSYSSHAVDPLQELRTPSSCLMGSPARDLLMSRRNSMTLPVTMDGLITVVGDKSLVDGYFNSRFTPPPPVSDLEGKRRRSSISSAASELRISKDIQTNCDKNKQLSRLRPRDTLTLHNVVNDNGEGDMEARNTSKMVSPIADTVHTNCLPPNYTVSIALIPLTFVFLFFCVIFNAQLCLYQLVRHTIYILQPCFALHVSKMGIILIFCLDNLNKNCKYLQTGKRCKDKISSTLCVWS